MRRLQSIVFMTFSLAIILLGTPSCSRGTGSDQEVDIDLRFEDLDNWELLANVTESQLSKMLSQNEPRLAAMLADRRLRDIKVFSMTYNTSDVEGGYITASGLVIVPKNAKHLPLVSYQHGTLLSDEEAPSNYNTEKLATLFSMSMAASNYVVVMPDYLGYGASANYPHPFQHRRTLGSVSFDMIMAVKADLNLVDDAILNDKLFITGYSEGGFATLALQKHIEENSNLSITMSAAASGVYNSSAFFREMMNLNEDYNYPGLAMWVFDSYDRIYGLNRNWAAYINEPYATTIKNTSHPFDFYTADLAKNPQDLYTSEFRKGILEGTDTTYLRLLADNDIFDWTPIYPITLYHGTADNLVFPLNAETAYTSLSANGASINRVIYEGEDHFSTGLLYIKDVFERFESLK